VNIDPEEKTAKQLAKMEEKRMKHIKTLVENLDTNY